MPICIAYVYKLNAVGLDSIDMSTMRGREDRAIAKLATCLQRERQRQR